eukprot:TRINITY_DN10150_c0_g2_i1.p1 TRINITY_DN10150_c0_g2~~TRINITY_DN10150_c0_g2_i1.p1  ORF type:complete len:316 (-),score=35.53 TRINITY_DN10150_c0_g2_i1:272-1219(-)
MTTTTYVLVDTPAKVTECAECLASTDQPLAVDLEGYSLSRSGGFGLLQLATRDGPVYLVDVVTLAHINMSGDSSSDDDDSSADDAPVPDPSAACSTYGTHLERTEYSCPIPICGDEHVATMRAAFAPDGLLWSIGALLTNPHRVKIFFDCRQDCDVLLHTAGVDVPDPVMDLQVAEVAYRRARGERAPHVFGLQKTIGQYLVRGDDAMEWHRTMELKERMTRTFRMDPTMWMRRPLTRDASQYAAADVLSLHALHRVLVPALPTHTLPLVWAGSRASADFARRSPVEVPNSREWALARPLPRPISIDHTRGTGLT